MPMYNSRTELRRFGLGKNHQELAQFIEGHINRVANGRIRDLHVVYSDEKNHPPRTLAHVSREATGASSRARSDRRPSSSGQSDRRVVRFPRRDRREHDAAGQTPSRHADMQIQHERRDKQAMEVRSTPSSPGAQGPGSARFLIDQGELRSILSNLSHELCRPLVSLRAGFDLLLGRVAIHDHATISAAIC